MLTAEPEVRSWGMEHTCAVSSGARALVLADHGDTTC